MKYAAAMGSGAFMYSYIPSFIKIGLRHSEVNRGIHRDRAKHGDLMSTFIFYFKIKKV
jgi:hypothetical protein